MKERQERKRDPDTRLRRLQPGEFVIRKQAAKKLGMRKLEKANRTGNWSRPKCK